jgi:hypothetical protein
VVCVAHVFPVICAYTYTYYTHTHTPTPQTTANKSRPTLPKLKLFQGVLRCLRQINNNQKGEGKQNTYQERISSSQSHLSKKGVGLAEYVTVYRSASRSEALALIGWCEQGKESDEKSANTRTEQNVNYENLLATLESNGEFEKATAIALFQLDLQRALLILTQASKTCLDINTAESKARAGSFNMLALAFSTYVSVLARVASVSAFEATCKNFASHSNENPYLRACVMFLQATSLDNGAADNKGRRKTTLQMYRLLLFDRQVDLHIRLSFALIFLDDRDIIGYCENSLAQCVTLGHLDGLILTGLSDTRAVNVLQAYLDRTSDIQTVALLSSFVIEVHSPEGKDKQAAHAQQNQAMLLRMEQWISIYRSLLNQVREPYVCVCVCVPLYVCVCVPVWYVSSLYSLQHTTNTDTSGPCSACEPNSTSRGV